MFTMLERRDKRSALYKIYPAQLFFIPMDVLQVCYVELPAEYDGIRKRE